MSGEVVIPGNGGTFYAKAADVLMGRCYEAVAVRPDGLFEGVGMIMAGPVTFSEYDNADGSIDDEGRRGMLRFVSCQSCTEEWEIPYLDRDVAVQHAKEWAHAHRCVPDEDWR